MKKIIKKEKNLVETKQLVYLKLVILVYEN